MKHNYSEISSKQFENLVIQLCYKLLGYGTKTFADGADGGRDARFDGEAIEIPSPRNSWNGLTIVQAKHTSEYNKKFSDSDFFGARIQGTAYLTTRIDNSIYCPRNTLTPFSRNTDN